MCFLLVQISADMTYRRGSRDTQYSETSISQMAFLKTTPERNCFNPILT